MQNQAVVDAGIAEIRNRWETIKLLSDEQPNIRVAEYQMSAIVQIAQSLAVYEERQVAYFDILPSKLLAQAQKDLETIVRFGFQQKVEKAIRDADTKTTVRSKLTRLARARSEIGFYRENQHLRSDVAKMDELLAEKIWQATYDDLKERAERYEFKNSMKRALDAWYDLLYFLRNDDRPDSSQIKEIREVESKITALGGSIR